jgi:pimeloyl-ACP methyl ester carboxylesterase
MHQVNEAVAIRVFTFEPAIDTKSIPIVLVPGMATVIESFHGILKGVSKNNPVLYIETREKSSSRLSGQVKFDMESLGDDVISVIDKSGFEENNYVLAGYSLGATAIVDCYQKLLKKPICVILIEPTPVFRLPIWSPILLYLAVPLYSILKPFAKWYLRNFKINALDDHEILQITYRALDQAEPRKLKNTLLSISGYASWNRIETVDCPVLVVATSKDTMHEHSDIEKMAGMFVKSEYTDMENNTRTHSEEMATVILEYVKKIS